ncbi:hepatocellular carcinoma-associated antigen 59-domain-containing protein [Daldinia bambusicola]|nr:hepatocellular carcinoma-associated antigen 59-domain-containing protein [Daldinia bambusicola]
MDSTASESIPVPPVIFRGKKRKTYRQRTESTATDDDQNERSKSIETPQLEDGTPTAQDAPVKSEATATTSTTQNSNAEEEEEKGLSVAEVLRLRNARKARLGGVKFGAGSSNSTHASNGDTATATGTTGDGLDDLSLMIREEENKALDIVAGVKKRFAPQTGMAAEVVNKHMEEYIEAELARRHNAAAAAAAAQNSSSTTSSGQSSSNNRDNQQSTTGIPTTLVTARPRPEQRNRALQGQLMEIDLGEEARSRNEALTERATRKLQGQAVDDDDDCDDYDDDGQLLRNGDGSGRPKKKVRLGRDGKPWRPRNRRNSDDIKRDQIVEEILRESRLDVYEAPTPPTHPSTSGANVSNANANDNDGQAADDRIAEEFRREFMDAMAERQKRRKKASNAPAGSGGSGNSKSGGNGKGGNAADDDVLRGPKLGGSRNVRAAMRNLLLEKAKEAKGVKGRGR